MNSETQEVKMTSSAYDLFRVKEWGEIKWVLAKPGNSVFGYYSTKSEALTDAKLYKLNVVRNESLDS